MRRSRHLHALLALLTVLVSVSLAGDASFSPELLNKVEREFGIAAKQRMLDWQQVIYRNRQTPELAITRNINDFFNRVRFISDQKHWGRADYWATPVEFLATNGGDCEDYSIAKYFTLRELGIPDEKLRITYVKALELNQAHMVLAYYPYPDAEPLILDNLNPNILPASQRTDLEPVYSFNGLGLWVAKERGAGYTSLGDPGRINFWRDLKVRMQQERQLGESYTRESYTRDNYNQQHNGPDTLRPSGP